MKRKIVMAFAAALVLVGWLIYPRSRPASSASGQAASFPTNRLTGPRLRAPRSPGAAAPAEPVADTSATNVLGRLLNGEGRNLSAEEVQAYLEKNHRSTESLIGAFRATMDRAFLKEAAEKNPNDPRVNFDAAFFGPPEERRKWLDALKQSAPDNALANYLSANDYFKSGQSDLAVQEIMAAGNKGNYQDYSEDFIQNAEEAYREAGRSEVEAKVEATTRLLLPHMSELKQAGLNLVELAKSYRQAGDEASAQAALQMAMSLGQRLDHPGSLTLIESLVGMAIQRNALSTMDPNLSYGDSGQTVQNQLDALIQQRKSMNAMVQPIDHILKTMPDLDLIAYFDRWRLYGEHAAMQWAISKYGQQ